MSKHFTGHYEAPGNTWEYGEIPRCEICSKQACFATAHSGVYLCESVECALAYVQEYCDAIELHDDGKAPCINCDKPTEMVTEGEYEDAFICKRCLILIEENGGLLEEKP